MAESRTRRIKSSMVTWSIVKILLIGIGALAVLEHTPGVSILQDEKADYKALVKCEAKFEGLGRECRKVTRECRGTLKKLKEERKNLEKKNRKLSKNLEIERRDYQGCVESLDSALSDRGGSSRGGLRGGKNGEAGDKRWRSIFLGR